MISLVLACFARDTIWRVNYPSPYLNYEPFVIFSLPCPAVEWSERQALVGAWHLLSKKARTKYPKTITLITGFHMSQSNLYSSLVWMQGHSLVTVMFPVFWKSSIAQIHAVCTSTVLHLTKLLRAHQSTFQCFL